MRLTIAQIAQLVGEIAPVCVPSRVERVQAEPPREIALQLEFLSPVLGSRHGELVLCADGALPRVWLTLRTGPRRDGPIGPFFQQVLRELEGAQLERLEAMPQERVVTAHFAGTSSGEPRSLRLELFTPHATLVLLGRAERILAVLDEPTGEPDSARTPSQARLAVGATWQAPARGQWQGADSAPSLQELARQALGATSEPPVGAAAQLPLSHYVASVLGEAARQAQRARDAADLSRRLSRRAERARSLVRGLEQRKDASGGAARVREDGEILLAHLHLVQRGQTQVELPDPFSDSLTAVRQIELDARLSPKANAQRCFERYKKLERAAAHVDAELAKARQAAEISERLLALLAEPASDPRAIEAQAMQAGLLEERPAHFARERAAKDGPKAARLPYRVFRATRGSEIWVGRSAADNDQLTLKLARGNDLWLHTADAPGSHVVLRLGKAAEPDPEEVLDAAHLAVHFSPLRGASKARVHVARRKQVHKPRGAKPGLVALSGGKELSLRLEAGRLERLLKGDGTEGER